MMMMVMVMQGTGAIQLDNVTADLNDHFKSDYLEGIAVHHYLSYV